MVRLDIILSQSLVVCLFEVMKQKACS